MLRSIGRIVYKVTSNEDATCNPYTLAVQRCSEQRGCPSVQTSILTHTLEIHYRCTCIYGQTHRNKSSCMKEAVTWSIPTVSYPPHPSFFLWGISRARQSLREVDDCHSLKNLAWVIQSSVDPDWIRAVVIDSYMMASTRATLVQWEEHGGGIHLFDLTRRYGEMRWEKRWQWGEID